MRRLCLGLSVCLSAVAGCHAEATVAPDRAAAAESDDTVVLGPRRTTRPGVPHGASILELALAPDGTGALSLDKAGSLRLWPALDGSREPIPIPGRGARAMSLARAGDDWVVAHVDAAGGTHVVAVGPDGEITPRFEIDPFDPVRAIEVLPGGDRVLALGEDHRLRLFDVGGGERATLERREFRPIRVMVTPSGAAAVLSVDDRKSGRVKGQVQLLEIGASTIEPVGAPVAFESPVEPDANGAALSPSGSALAHLGRDTGKWNLRVRSLADGGQRTIELEMQDAQTPVLGFVGEHQVLVTSRDRGSAWLVDIRDRARRPRVTAHQPSQPMPIAHRVGLQVVGYGTHLAVQRLRDDGTGKIDYLGYRGFVAQAGAVSPSGANIAWSVGGEILIEPLDRTREPKRLRPEASFGVQFLAFMDEDHLVGIGSDGAARVYRWKSGEVVDEVSLGTGVQAAYFDVAHGLVLAHRLWGDAAVLELDDDQTLAGPYLVSDGAFRIGLLTGAEPGLWTVDAGNKRRIYSLADLRGDLSQAEVAERGETLIVPGGSQVMSLDRGEVSYQIVNDGMRRELHRRKGSESPVKVSLGAHQISHVMLAPDGSSVLAVSQQTGTVLAFEARTLKSKWTFSAAQMQGLPTFSPDGRQLVYLSTTGAAVLDADTGEVVMRRCGADFRLRGAPPFDAFSFSETPSFCE